MQTPIASGDDVIVSCIDNLDLSRPFIDENDLQLLCEVWSRSSLIMVQGRDNVEAGGKLKELYEKFITC